MIDYEIQFNELNLASFVISTTYLGYKIQFQFTNVQHLIIFQNVLWNLNLQIICIQTIAVEKDVLGLLERPSKTRTFSESYNNYFEGTTKFWKVTKVLEIFLSKLFRCILVKGFSRSFQRIPELLCLVRLLRSYIYYPSEYLHVMKRLSKTIYCFHL